MEKSPLEFWFLIFHRRFSHYLKRNEQIREAEEFSHGIKGVYRDFVP